MTTTLTTRSHSRPAATALAIAVLLHTAGCGNPFGRSPLDYGPRPSAERLRSITSLDRDRYAQPPSPVEVPARPGGTYVSRFAGLTTVDLSIEQARAAVLESNLDVRVAIIAPTTADERLREEEAKFEAVFRPNVGYRDVNTPTFDITAPNQQKVVNAGAGVDVPLRTGGRASVDFLTSKQETDSTFFTADTAYSTALTFSLSQPLLRNAGRRANTYTIRVAAADRDISEARAKLEIIRQVANADRAYWRLYAARESLKVRQKQYELAQAQLERARRRVEAGDAPQLEVTRAESGAASQLDEIIQAEKAVLDQQREIKRLINRPELDIASKTLLTTATLPDPVRYEFDGGALAEIAVNNRMEMLELELQLAQDFFNIEYQKNQALPLFTLDFAYSVPGLGTTLGSSVNQLNSTEFSDWRFSLNGQIPIGNEAAKARVEQAILTRLSRLSSKDARRLAIRSEVIGAVDAIEAAWNRILATRQAVVLAAATLEGEQRQFDAGARTSTDVLDAAARLADEQTNEVRALAEYQIAQVELAFATGTLLGAGKVEWSPLDPRQGLPARGDPTPFSWPFYQDPEKARTPAQAEIDRASNEPRP
jgi:outer membrane protein TolC